MSQKHLKYVVAALASLAIIFLVVAAISSNVTMKFAQDELPVLAPMERVGSIKNKYDTIFLWVFDFEDRRCLWATGHLSSGLDCWDPTLIYR